MKATAARYEAEVIEGLGPIAAEEIDHIKGTSQLYLDPDRPDSLRFMFSGHPHALLDLKCSQAVYAVLGFEIPRPKALLGDQHFRRLTSGIQYVLSLHPVGTFATLGISAAGSESSVMQRVRQALAAAVGLQAVSEKGDLLIRIRRAAASSGWECLIRLTPRPLATRSWRVRNYEGALNATVAQAMSRLTQPRPEDIVINLACGSGSLLIERMSICAARSVYGVESSAIALDAARANLAAAGHSPARHLICADATRLPLPGSTANIVLADMPFGHRVGSHDENEALYPAVLGEAARITRRAAYFVLLTHEIRLMERLMASNRSWQLLSQIRITLRGLHPRIYVLQRL